MCTPEILNNLSASSKTMLCPLCVGHSWIAGLTDSYIYSLWCLVKILLEKNFRLATNKEFGCAWHICSVPDLTALVFCCVDWCTRLGYTKGVWTIIPEAFTKTWIFFI